MKKPLLQVALDNDSLEEAFASLSGGLADVVDIIEVGTMLMLQEGAKAITMIQSAYPDKKMVADFKVMYINFAKKILDRGTEYMTCLSACDDREKAKILAAAQERGKNQKVQIECYGAGAPISDEQIAKWKEMGFEQIIFARPHDRRNTPWGKEDYDDIKKLCDMGWEVTVTGGMTYDDIDAIAGLPIHAIICGRSVRNAPDPCSEARRIQAKLAKLWEQ